MLTKLCYNRKQRIAASAPPDLAPEDADCDRSQSGHFCSSPECREGHDSISKSESDLSSYILIGLLPTSTSVSSMHSFSSIPAHPQASLAHHS